MTIQIEYETERKLEIPYEKLAEKVASHILELEECPYETSVNLVITDNVDPQGKCGISSDRCTDRRAFFPDDPV